MDSIAPKLRSWYALLCALFLSAVAFQIYIFVETFLDLRALPDPTSELVSGNWLLTILLHYLVPTLCLAFGFYVAAVRIEDRRAWVVLAMLLSLSIALDGVDQRDRAMDWNSPLKHLVLVYRTLGVRSWTIWLMLFALYFPTRAAFDIRRPAWKWVVLAPCLMACGLSIVERVGRNEGGTWATRVEGLTRVNSWLLTFLTWVPIAFFVGILAAKFFRAAQGDARRRLRLLFFGLTCSIVPPSIFNTVVHYLGIRDSEFPSWLLLLIYLPYGLFPMVLAYVTVVQQAFDVRVVVRQGLQYALARRGLAVVVLATSMVVIVVVALASGDKAFAQRFWITAAGVGLLLSISLGGRRLAQWIDRKFFREAYRAEQILSRLAESMRSVVEVDLLVATVREKITEALHVKDMAVFVKPEAGPRSTVMGDEAPWTGLSLMRELEVRRRPLPVGSDRVLVPIPGRTETLGFLNVGPRVSEAPYSRSDLELLQTVASQTGLAIENSRLTNRVAAETAEREIMQRELAIARDVQQRLFPQVRPEIQGLDYIARCRPAHEVGGDYYDYFLLSGNVLVLLSVTFPVRAFRRRS